MRRGLFVPPFGELADPRALAELAAIAEGSGWDGIFLWDHLVFPGGFPPLVDPWISLAAIAAATRRISLGTMVTPLPRRRPTVLARQLAALDLLSEGRLVFGVGLGDLRGGEFEVLGEELDPVRRGRMLDEALELIHALLSGQQVDHQGERYRVGGASFLPTPQQQPLPTWVAARWPNRRPIRRACRYQGIFVIQIAQPQQILELRQLLQEFGPPPPPFEVVVTREVGADPGPWREAGVTWLLTQVGPGELRRREVEAVISAGPER